VGKGGKRRGQLGENGREHLCLSREKGGPPKRKPSPASRHEKGGGCRKCRHYWFGWLRLQPWEKIREHYVYNSAKEGDAPKGAFQEEPELEK